MNADILFEIVALTEIAFIAFWLKQHNLARSDAKETDFEGSPCSF